MSRCCKIQSFCVPVKCDLSMTLSPDKSLSVSSAEEFLSEIEPSIMRPRNLIGLEWIEGIGDETSGWTDVFETEKGVVFRSTLDNDNRVLICQLWALGQPRSKQLCTEKVKFELQNLWWSLGLGHLWKHEVTAKWYY